MKIKIKMRCQEFIKLRGKVQHTVWPPPASKEGGTADLQRFAWARPDGGGADFLRWLVDVFSERASAGQTACCGDRFRHLCAVPCAKESSQIRSRRWLHGRCLLKGSIHAEVAAAGPAKDTPEFKGPQRFLRIAPPFPQINVGFLCSRPLQGVHCRLHRLHSVLRGQAPSLIPACAGPSSEVPTS